MTTVCRNTCLPILLAIHQHTIRRRRLRELSGLRIRRRHERRIVWIQKDELGFAIVKLDVVEGRTSEQLGGGGRDYGIDTVIANL